MSHSILLCVQNDGWAQKSPGSSLNLRDPTRVMVLLRYGGPLGEKAATSPAYKLAARSSSRRFDSSCQTSV